MNFVPPGRPAFYRACAALAALGLGVAVPCSAAVYEVTFAGTWSSADTNAGTVPDSAHFTRLVGATHRPGHALWAPGELATPGVEDVAELGDARALEGEIATLVAAGVALTTVQADGLDRFPGSTTASFETTRRFSSVSALSMVAPSPDWFVGVHDLSLLDGAGNWRQSVSVELLAWDAGTEDGGGFSLANDATVPAEPIALLADSPFIDNAVLGTLSLELTAVPLPPAMLLMASGVGVWLLTPMRQRAG